MAYGGRKRKIKFTSKAFATFDYVALLFAHSLREWKIIE